MCQSFVKCWTDVRSWYPDLRSFETSLPSCLMPLHLFCPWSLLFSQGPGQGPCSCSRTQGTVGPSEFPEPLSLPSLAVTFHQTLLGESGSGDPVLPPKHCVKLTFGLLVWKRKGPGPQLWACLSVQWGFPPQSKLYARFWCCCFSRFDIPVAH